MCHGWYANRDFLHLRRQGWKYQPWHKGRDDLNPNARRLTHDTGVSPVPGIGKLVIVNDTIALFCVRWHGRDARVTLRRSPRYPSAARAAEGLNGEIVSA